VQKLELLVGCQSLYGVVERQIAARQIDILGVTIILVWALSPVGGQSSLRLLNTSPHLVSFNTTIRYLPREAAAYTLLDGGDDASLGWPLYAPLYMTAVRTARNHQTQPMDLWGNVKIPDFDSLTARNSDPYEGWVKVDYSSNVPYSSLLGIPVIGVPTTGNSTYQLTSRYSIIDCFDIFYFTNYSQSEMTTNLPNASAFSTEPATFLMLQSGANKNYSATDVQYFMLLSSTDGTNYQFSGANCSVGIRNVDASVHCAGLSCFVDSMRKSETGTYGDTMFEAMILHDQSNLWAYFPLATIGYASHGGSGSNVGSSLTELWIANPDTNFTDWLQFANFSTLDGPTLSSRLQMVYNAYFQTTYSSRYLAGNLSTDLNYYDNATMDGTSFDQARGISFNSSNASVSQINGEIYRFNWAYGTLLLLISALLLVAGLTSLILKRRTLAPDILGYTSTTTRDNQYFDLAEDSHPPSYLDGLERAKALRHTRVMIGDVRPDARVGHIAFTAMGTGSQRLVKGRTYD
jgi:hypothetical protein